MKSESFKGVVHAFAGGLAMAMFLHNLMWYGK